MIDKEQTQLDTLPDDAERERRELEIDKQDYYAAMKKYKANPISYSLDEVEKELKQE